jgi:hypothetical protein
MKHSSQTLTGEFMPNCGMAHVFAEHSSQKICRAPRHVSAVSSNVERSRWGGRQMPVLWHAMTRIINCKVLQKAGALNRREYSPSRSACNDGDARKRKKLSCISCNLVLLGRSATAAPSAHGARCNVSYGLLDPTNPEQDKPHLSRARHITRRSRHCRERRRKATSTPHAAV